MLEGALRRFDKAVALSTEAADDQTRADALFHIGRIHNARNEFEMAERTLNQCIKLCRAAGLGPPHARAQLALAWARREQNEATETVITAFEAALALAEAEDDAQTAADADRQLGFMSWVRLRDRAQSRRTIGRRKRS